MASSNDFFSTKIRDRKIGQQLDSYDFPKDLTGKALKIPKKNFTTTIDQKIRSYAGPPAYALRARKIEDSIAHLYNNLEVRYSELLENFGKEPIEFARKWKEVINSLELDTINRLIEKHNEYYPIEANLPMDMETSRYMLGSAPWKSKQKLSKERLFVRFPLEYPRK